MPLANLMKSKKIMLGAGAVVVILVVFFALKFMTSSTDQGESDKPRQTPKTVQKVTKPTKKDETDKSPLYEAMQALKDPFQSEDPKAAEIKNKLDLTKKEVEYLKAILEERKLKQEIKEIEKSLTEQESPGSEEAVISSSDGNSASKSGDQLLVKAILIMDEKRSALLVSGDKRTWVHEGEHFDGWKIKEIREESVVVLKKGKTFVFFYDRQAIGIGGES
jgi:flagellar basal body-associated protein FliL